MNEAPALVATDVCKHFALGDQTVEVLRGVSLCAEEGQSLALIGPSGSGKSTLLHLLGTLEPPTSGQIAISGQDPLALPEPQLARFRNQQIGFVFQNHHLLPQYSALENALIPTLAFPQADRRERARDLLHRRRSNRASAPPPRRAVRRRVPARGCGARLNQPARSLALRRADRQPRPPDSHHRRRSTLHTAPRRTSRPRHRNPRPRTSGALRPPPASTRGDVRRSLSYS